MIALLHPTTPPCMGDPEIDHGFMYDDQGQTDVLRSPFFDVNLNVDDTVDGYIDRILFTLVPSIEEHIPTGSWQLIGRPPSSPPPATSPTNYTIGATCLLVASLGFTSECTYHDVAKAEMIPNVPLDVACNTIEAWDSTDTLNVDASLSNKTNIARTSTIPIIVSKGVSAMAGNDFNGDESLDPSYTSATAANVLEIHLKTT
ncbi:hypothetical protein M5K25_023996 [Dendrobium thyrsiflorum]|uniref:Uncharacterized protein n=1 Tax=Dendrobium thyrsiflorum TaxID=117978 RepID=A0ABD0U0X1_DENTH